MTVDKEIAGTSPVCVSGEELTHNVSGLRLSTCLVGDRFVMAGGRWGAHSIAADVSITSAARLLAHWRGYVENNA